MNAFGPDIPGFKVATEEIDAGAQIGQAEDSDAVGHGLVECGPIDADLGERFLRDFHDHHLDQDLLAGKHTFDKFAFSVDKNGTLELTDDGKEVLDEAMFLANSAEARGLPGFRGASA